MNRYSDKLLGFECDLPEGWPVMPGDTSEKLEELLEASPNIPFLRLQCAQGDPDESIAMIQFTAKPLRGVQQMGGSDGLP